MHPSLNLLDFSIVIFPLLAQQCPHFIIQLSFREYFCLDQPQKLFYQLIEFDPVSLDPIAKPASR